jgi:pyruvate dehydrogenase E2 component (dihydrolipoamide acetyltransferase)
METLLEVKVPDIGEFKDVDVIEVMVKPGDTVGLDDPLIAIESEKATMEVPAPHGGVIKDIKVKLGDKVSEGSLILTIEAADAPSAASSESDGEAAPAVRETKASIGEAKATLASSPSVDFAPSAPSPNPNSGLASASAAVASTGSRGSDAIPAQKPHASPSVRKFARELGVDLARVKGSGLNGRIFRVDVQKFVATELSARDGSGGAGFDLLPWPKVDFSKFGVIESQALSRIRKFSKANLARNWVMIPHVTQFDEADVTELEAFRIKVNKSQPKPEIKVTMLAFILKALVTVLSEFPEFNSSLDGDNLILKKYFHLGFAADTPNGLVVPVLRDVDKKGVLQIARETADLAALAREGKLKMTDIQGGCFTVSSLGGIGGTAFTPIINAPEVAILGVSRLTHKPVYRDGTFVPRLILPLSLSYDHRVIDGAIAARFTTHLAGVLDDMRRALL